MKYILLITLIFAFLISCDSKQDGLSENQVSSIFADISVKAADQLYVYTDSGEPVDGRLTNEYPDGQMHADLTFAEGRITEGKVWHESGSVFINASLQDENFVLSTYSEDGIKTRKNIISANDWKLRESYSWFENGSPKSELTPDVIREWYANGNVKSEVNFKNGEMNGRIAKWYENGQLAGEAFYINNKLDGEYLEWDEDGNLITQKEYEMGDLILE